MKKSIVYVIIVVLVIGIVSGVTYLVLDSKHTTESLNSNEEEEMEEDYTVYIQDVIKDYNLEDLQDIINDNQVLFVKYAKAVIANDKIEDYREYVFNIFQLVVEYKEYMQEDYFFNRLAELEILINPNLPTDGAGGGSVICLAEFDKNSEEFDADVHVLYHELVHFLQQGLVDYNTVSDYESVYPYLVVDPFVEGGAEAIASKYFNNGFTSTYYLYVQQYELFCKLFGEDLVSKMVFTQEYDRNFYNYLMADKKISEDNYRRFIDYNRMRDDLVNENFVYFMDVCVDIYEELYNKKWYEDEEFSYAVYAYLYDFVNDKNLYDSTHKEEYIKYFANYKAVRNSIIESIGKDNYSLDSMSQILFYKDITYLVLYVTGTKDNEAYKIVVDYDFENQKINDYEIRKG